MSLGCGSDSAGLDCDVLEAHPHYDFSNEKKKTPQTQQRQNNGLGDRKNSRNCTLRKLEKRRNIRSSTSRSNTSEVLSLNALHKYIAQLFTNILSLERSQLLLTRPHAQL
jgi:hypothetical protein